MIVCNIIKLSHSIVIYKYIYIYLWIYPISSLPGIGVAGGAHGICLPMSVMEEDCLSDKNTLITRHNSSAAWRMWMPFWDFLGEMPSCQDCRAVSWFGAEDVSNGQFIGWDTILGKRRINFFCWFLYWSVLCSKIDLFKVATGGWTLRGAWLLMCVAWTCNGRDDDDCCLECEVLSNWSPVLTDLDLAFNLCFLRCRSLFFCRVHRWISCSISESVLI